MEASKQGRGWTMAAGGNITTRVEGAKFVAVDGYYLMRQRGCLKASEVPFESIRRPRGGEIELFGS